MTIEILGHSAAYEVECLVRVFYPGRKLCIVRCAAGDPDTVSTWVRALGDARAQVRVHVRLGDFDSALEGIVEDQPDTIERQLCVLLFRLLCVQTGQRPPWGILTGVRPVRICRSLWERGMGDDEVLKTMTRRYLALPEKIRLCLETGRQERRVLEKAVADGFCLYIGIPFCPSRCLYCSFVSHEIQRARRLVPDYLRLLAEEIRLTGKIARSLGLKLQAVYVGGGTPTTLCAEQLTVLMTAVGESFDFSQLLEYTVEAGRPDTITPEKLCALRAGGADRISINPQTMDDRVLEEIGRKHTVRQTLEACRMAREQGFACVNMDLIAGLPGETAEGFVAGLGQVIGLAPENVTLHALAVKRSSHLREREDAFAPRELLVAPLLDRAWAMLGEAGYLPYYLYRQKGTLENLENTGYTRPGFEGAYNVFAMEEVQTVLAVGAGGITKLCAPGVIKRVHNYKYPYEYIAGFEALRQRKSQVEEFYAGHFGKKIHAH